MECTINGCYIASTFEEIRLFLHPECNGYIQLNKLSEPMIDVWQSRSAAIASLQQQLRCVNHINENSMQNANVISIKNITDHLFLL